MMKRPKGLRKWRLETAGKLPIRDRIIGQFSFNSAILLIEQARGVCSATCSVYTVILLD